MPQRIEYRINSFYLFKNLNEVKDIRVFSKGFVLPSLFPGWYKKNNPEALIEFTAGLKILLAVRSVWVLRRGGRPRAQNP